MLYILFIFWIWKKQNKIIIFILANDKDLNSPKFYSSQIYILLNSLIFKFTKGSGTISFDEYQKIEKNQNYLGKSISIQCSEDKIFLKSEESFIHHLY